MKLKKNMTVRTCEKEHRFILNFDAKSRRVTHWKRKDFEIIDQFFPKHKFTANIRVVQKLSSFISKALKHISTELQSNAK